MKLLIIHGPNLNLLGEREPEIYGKLTLKELDQKIKKHAQSRKIMTRTFQDNSEGALIDFIHKNRKWASGIVINPGAYTHYSLALRDAIAAVNLPTIEVHLSDISKREEFRRHSVIKDVCITQISGQGVNSYLLAIDHLHAELSNRV